MQQILLPQGVCRLMQRFRDAGYTVHAVGGCVRDALRGVPVHDYDLTTSALPQQVSRLFSDCRLIETGIRHGTVTVIWEQVPYEITTHRLDGDYPDGRHPRQVTFTASLREDLARRDFTANAIAYAPWDGLIDPFGGVADIRCGILRAVGTPEVRFREDALRILRGVRFIARFGWRADAATDRALIGCAPLLQNISRERIREELCGFFKADEVFACLIRYRAVFEAALPQLEALTRSAYHESAGHARQVSAEHPWIRLLALLLPLGEAADAAIASLRPDGRTAADLCLLRDAIMQGQPESNRDAAALYIRLGPGRVRLLSALLHACGGEWRRVEKVWDEIGRQQRPYTLSMLALDGDDLKKYGLSGAAIGHTLQRLLTGACLGIYENTKESLLAHLEECT